MYTKGEWSVIEGKKGGLHIIRTLPNAGVNRICEVVIPSIGYRVEAEANAHLIAAAPDMYEALKAIINSETCTGRDRFNNALKALAKADA